MEADYTSVGVFCSSLADIISFIKTVRWAVILMRTTARSIVQLRIGLALGPRARTDSITSRQAPIAAALAWAFVDGSCVSCLVPFLCMGRCMISAGYWLKYYRLYEEHLSSPFKVLGLFS